MQLIVYGNKTYEEEKALVDVSTGKVLLQGDWYHDKIDSKIEGYLEALKNYDLYTEDVPTQWIDPSDSLFNKLNFYEGDDEDFS